MSALLLAALLAADPADAADAPAWPDFLGPDATGQVLADATLPVAWSGVEPKENIAWTASLPDGQSSPVVAGGVVYATGVEGPNKERNVLVAVALADGEELWRKESTNTAPKQSSYYVARAAPTPAVDADGVYAFFEGGDLLAYTHDGELRWSRALSDEYGELQGPFQLGSSPAQTDDALFVLVDDPGPSYLLCVDKATGENRWKADRPARTAWSSPVVMDLGGTAQVVTSTQGAVDGYDAATGEKLWSFTDLGGNTVATPVPVPPMPGTVLIGASPGGPRQEDAGRAIRSNLALKLPTEAGGEPEVLWRAKNLMTGFASPLAYRGRTYWIGRNGVLTCLRAEDGEPLFKERLAEDSWATPLAAGEHIYFFGKDGRTTVIKPADTFEEVAVNTLFSKDAPAAGGRGDGDRGEAMFGGEIQYGAAVADGTIVIRTNRALTAVR